MFMISWRGMANSHEYNEAEGEGEVALDTEWSVPPEYAVVLHNDDYTTMDFVIEVLSKFFQRTQEEAVKIMLKVHQEGKGVAGVYSFEIAETKAMQVHEYAKSKGHPLKCTVEPME